MRTPQFTDYLPGRVYRPDREGMLQDPIDDVVVESTGVVADCPYRLVVGCGASVSPREPTQLQGKMVVVAELGAFRAVDDDASRRALRPPRSTPALARAWVQLAHLVLPLTLWHVTPILEAAYNLPQSRERTYHDPVSYEDIQQFPKTAGWDLSEPRHWASRCYERTIRVPIAEDAARKSSAPLEKLLTELPPVFGSRPRLWRNSLRHGTDGGSYVSLNLCDHTQDCLRTLDYEHRTTLALRLGIDGGELWQIKDVASHLSVPRGRIAQLEREGLDLLRREAAVYSLRPHP